MQKPVQATTFWSTYTYKHVWIYKSVKIFTGFTLQMAAVEVWFMSESSWIMCSKVPTNPTKAAAKMSELSR